MHNIIHLSPNPNKLYTRAVLTKSNSCSRTDGSFAVNDVPSGSYVVEVVTPNYRFEPVRVDITSKGKMR